MMKMQRWARWVSLAATLSAVPAMVAQSTPTATQRFGLSAFGGATGTYTDIFGRRNLGLTLGGDLTFRSFYGLTPSFELRGTYPIKSGSLAGEKNVLLGLKVEKKFGIFHPYADFLVGRGQIDYQNGGYVSGRFIYTYSSSTVYSPGIGVDLDLTNHWALKADVQKQLWTTYPLELKILKPTAITGGVVYRFDFNHHPKAERPRKEARPTPRAVSSGPDVPPRAEAPPPPNPAP